jgi:predicted RNase H-like nuclease (RuvC/YqgF family)
MDWAPLVSLVVAGFALVGTLAQTLQQHLKTERETRVQEAANVVLGYNHLTEDLWSQMLDLRGELTTSKQRICELERLLEETRASYREERAAWEAERRVLTERVAQLQAELRELQRQRAAIGEP